MIDIDQIGAAVFVVARRGDGSFVYETANVAVERVTGLSRDAMIGHAPESVLAPAVAALLNADYAACLAARETLEVERIVPLPVGDRVTRTTLTPLFDKGPDGAVTRLLGTIADVTEPHRLRQDLSRANARLAVAVDALGGAPWFYDARQNAFEISPAFDRLLGTAEPGTRTLDVAQWQALVHPEDRDDTCFANILAGRQEEGSATFRMPTRDGEPRWFLCRRRSVKEGVVVTGIAGIIVDVTQQKRREAALSLQAASDSLTGLSNRRGFEEVLTEEQKRAAAFGQPLSLLMIDVDHFKRYNDTYGHIAGDGVLQRLADCLRRVVEAAGGHAARFGGEEFVAVLPRQTTTGAADVAATILQGVAAMAEPHRASPTGTVSVSIGVAGHAGARGRVCADLIALADSALYRAKSDGRDCYRVRVAARLRAVPAEVSSAA